MLSIVVIAFNEKRTIKKAVDMVRSLDINKEIIVVDNGSTDGTADILKNLNYNDINLVLQDKNYGVGKSYETGFKLAKGEYVFIQHADLEYDYTICLKMLKLARENDLDAVFGSRILESLKSKTRFDLFRERPAYLASFVTTFLINKFYNYNFTDVIGAEFYKTSSITKIPINTYHTGFKFEHVSRMCKANMRIAELNVDYSPRHNPADKKIKPYNMINAIWTMLKVRVSQ